MAGTANRAAAAERTLPALPEGQEAAADKRMRLRDLVHRAEPHERMPLPLPESLKRNVWACLAINAASVLLVPHIARFFAGVFPVQSGFYRVVRTDGLMNLALGLALQALPYLLYVNAVGLGLALLFFLITLGMRRMVSEPVHWLGWLPALPSGLAVMGTGITVFLVVGVFLLTLLIWALIITIALMVLAAVLGGAGQSGN